MSPPVAVRQGASAPEAPLPGRPRFHGVVVFAGLGFGLTAPFTALLVVALGGAPEWAAYVVSSMGLSLLVVDFFGTRFVPRLGPRGALTASMLVFGAGSLLSAVATTWTVVGLARVLQGFGAALFMGGGVQLAVRLVRPDRRGGAIGTFNAAWFAGIAVGPLGGGLIAAVLPGADGLRLLFAVCAVLNLLGAAAAWFGTPLVTAVTGPPRLGLPRGLGVRGVRGWSVLALAALGQAVRSGLALTLVPLLGAELAMGWVPLGVALFALAVTDVSVMHWGARWADRRGRALPLTLALAWGVLVIAGLAVLSPTTPHAHLLFGLGALAAGVTVGATWVLPTAMTVDLATDQEAALATYRIASDVGMLGGGLLAGVGLLLGGIPAGLLAIASLLAAGLVVTVAVGETRPAGAPAARHDPAALHAPAAPHTPDVPDALPARPVTLEVRMPLPPIEEFAVFAANQDLALTPERLAQAYATHTAYRADLERLRAIPLPFTDPVTEPATATAWIANGGRS